MNTLMTIVIYQQLFHSIVITGLTLFIWWNLYSYNNIRRGIKIALLSLLAVAVVLQCGLLASSVIVGYTGTVEQQIHDSPTAAMLKNYLSIFTSLNYPIVILVLSVVVFRRKE